MKLVTILFHQWSKDFMQIALLWSSSFVAIALLASTHWEIVIK
jgi:hypothetical protein